MKSEIIPATESITVEFKTSFNEVVIETLVAFSNAKGGMVYLGVTDHGEIKGIQIGKESIQNWINEIKNKTVPQIIPDVEILSFENKQVVVLTVIEYPVKPVSTRGRYYKRTANANHLMGIEEIANEHLKTINSSWDFYQDPIHSIKDISIEKVSRFVKIIEQRTQSSIEMSEMDFLEKLEIIRNNELTFGGYLLFVKDYCLISDVQIGRFKSNITIIDSISLNTDLFTETEEIIAFIKRHLMVEYIITGEPQRTERFDYPLDAIREIVINMIVHRDYRDSSGSIIKIFDNRIEFYNPGSLYGGITIQDLLSGNYTSKSRNKLIAKAFKEIGLIERYGSGIMRIRRYCEEFGIKDPIFNETNQGFQVVLYKEKLNDTHNDTVNDIDKVTYNVTNNDTNDTNDTDNSINDTDNDTNDTDNDTDNDINDTDNDANDTDRRKRILHIIEYNSKISTTKLAKQLSVSKSTILRDVKLLKMKNNLKRIGKERNGHWEVI